MTDELTIGVSGLAGSFSEEAALRYAKHASITAHLVYLIDMEGVLSALSQNKIDIGIFPVVNIHGGLVKPAFEAMGKYLFTPIDELWLDVNQCLLALPGMTLKQIQNIASHPQAFAQCKKYLNHKLMRVPHITWIDTAKAAKDLSDGILSNTTAVIAPARAAEIYHLDILEKNIQDHNPNLTAFIIAKRYGEIIDVDN